jgi:hypothetical protein
MKVNSVNSRILLTGFILLMSGAGLMGQLIMPQGKSDQGQYTFKDAMKAYDEWASVPANLEQKGWKAYGRLMEFNRSRRIGFYNGSG